MEDQRVRPTGPGRSIAVALVGAVSLALIAALTLGGGDDEAKGPDGVETGPVVVSGDGLPEFAGIPGDSAVGRIAPDFDATTFDGQDVLIRPGEGSGYVLAFFAHWCPHCQAEVPKLVEWIGRAGIPAGVEVVAVSTSVRLDRGNPPRAWLAGEGWNLEAVRDNEIGTLAKAYGLSSFPYFVVIGTDGRVRNRVGGGLTPEEWSWMLDQAGRSGVVPTGSDTT